MSGRIVVMQHKDRFIPIGVGLAYALGQRGIVVYVAGYAFAECVLGPSVCTADIPESSVALFLQEIGCPRTAEPSASLPDLYTAVGVDAVPFFRIYAGFYIWSLNVNPHPSGFFREEEFACVFRTFGMPADHRIYISGRQYLFGFSFPESIPKYFQFAVFLGHFQPVVPRTFYDRTVFHIDASFNEGCCK